MSSGSTSKPVLTLITPCLNAHATLADTLLGVSVLSGLFHQRGQRIQHLLIDGGSTDGTLELIQEYRHSHSFVDVIQHIDGGPYAAMNVGLKEATGIFTHILNADDCIWSHQAYMQNVAQATDRNADVILSPILYFARPGLEVRSLWPLHHIDDNLQQFQEKIRNGAHCPHPGFMARTTIYRSYGFDQTYSLSADYKLMQSILLGLAARSQLHVCSQILVGMAMGGLTGHWRSVLTGYFQLQAINRELGISCSALQRYGIKFLRRCRPITVPE